jgi:hypothetical protein
MRAIDYKPRTLRHPVSLTGQVKRASGEVREVPVSDLSIDGCCVRGFYRIGEPLQVQLPKIGWLGAQVRWAMMGRAGLRFVRSGDRAHQRS